MRCLFDRNLDKIQTGRSADVRAADGTTADCVGNLRARQVCPAQVRIRQGRIPKIRPFRLAPRMSAPTPFLLLRGSLIRTASKWTFAPHKRIGPHVGRGKPSRASGPSAHIGGLDGRALPDD